MRPQNNGTKIKTQDNELNGSSSMPSKSENSEKEILLRPFTTRNETTNNCRYHSRNIIVFNILLIIIISHVALPSLSDSNGASRESSIRASFSATTAELEVRRFESFAYRSHISHDHVSVMARKIIRIIN